MGWTKKQKSGGVHPTNTLPEGGSSTRQDKIDNRLPLQQGYTSFFTRVPHCEEALSLRPETAFEKKHDDATRHVAQVYNEQHVPGIYNTKGCSDNKACLIGWELLC